MVAQTNVCVLQIRDVVRYHDSKFTANSRVLRIQKYRFSLSMENAGVRPHSILDWPMDSFFGSGNLKIVTFFPTPLTPQVSPYPLTYIRPSKGSVVVNVTVMIDSPHCTFTVKYGSVKSLSRNNAYKIICLSPTYNLGKLLVLYKWRSVWQLANWLQDWLYRQNAASRMVSLPNSRLCRPCIWNHSRCDHISPRTKRIIIESHIHSRANR